MRRRAFPADARPTPGSPESPSGATSEAAPAPADPRLLDRARREVLQLAYWELQDATLAAAAVIVAFAAGVGWLETSFRPWPWFAAMLAATAFRFQLTRRFGRVAAGPYDYHRWARLHVAVVLATGLGWGVSVWLFPTFAQPGTPALVHGLILAGLAAGATRVLLPVRGASTAYLLLVLAPLALRLAAAGDLAGLAGAASIGAFVAYLARAAIRHQETLPPGTRGTRGRDRLRPRRAFRAGIGPAGSARTRGGREPGQG